MWRFKYFIFKNDDCVVVCFFFEDLVFMEVLEIVNYLCIEFIESVIIILSKDGEKKEEVLLEIDEIVLVLEMKEVKMFESCRNEFKKIIIFVECIFVKDDEEWLVLEGLIRVNSFLSIFRFFFGEFRLGSWRKWL